MAFSVNDGGAFADLSARIRGFKQSAYLVGDAAAKECAELLLDVSQPLVPEDTGLLKISGKVQKVPRTKDPTYQVVYSATAGERARVQGSSAKIKNPDFNYAWIQHENLEYHHEKGQAKYLEEPYEENKDLFMELIADALRASMSKGFRRRGGA